jgi:hypothetical protein
MKINLTSDIQELGKRRGWTRVEEIQYAVSQQHPTARDIAVNEQTLGFTCNCPEHDGRTTVRLSKGLLEGTGLDVVTDGYST